MSQRVIDERPTMFDSCLKCGLPLRYYLPRVRRIEILSDGSYLRVLTSVPREDGLCEACARKLGLTEVPMVDLRQDVETVVHA